jgi:hypothetical protein
MTLLANETKEVVREYEGLTTNPAAQPVEAEDG